MWYTKENFAHKEDFAVDSFVAWLKQLQFDGVWQTAVLVCASLLCITFHETCHGLVAYWLGDRTAKNAGRLTLNPIKHVDIAGLLMMALFRFGWAKPVPVDMRNFKKPKWGMALTALAGPVSNVLLAYLAVLLYMVCCFFWKVKNVPAAEYLCVFCYYVQVISAGLAVFNLFPIPPLDGSKVVFSLLPDGAYAKLMHYERYGMTLLAVLLIFGVLDTPLVYLRSGLLEALQAAGFWPFELLMKIYR